MLGLKLPTDPRWADLAGKSIEEILTDHAYCEQKAASTSISLIQTYPDFVVMVDSLVPIVTEEWGHFKMVLDHLKKRDLKLGRQPKTNMLTNSTNLLSKVAHVPIHSSKNYCSLRSSKPAVASASVYFQKTSTILNYNNSTKT